LLFCPFSFGHCVICPSSIYEILIIPFVSSNPSSNLPDEAYSRNVFVHTKLYIDLYLDFLVILKSKVPHRTSASYYLEKIITPNVFLRVCVMVFSTTLSNSLAISWWSVLLVEETGVPGKKNRPVAMH